MYMATNQTKKVLNLGIERGTDVIGTGAESRPSTAVDTPLSKHPLSVALCICNSKMPPNSKCIPGFVWSGNNGVKNGALHRRHCLGDRVAVDDAMS